MVIKKISGYLFFLVASCSLVAIVGNCTFKDPVTAGKTGSIAPCILFKKSAESQDDYMAFSRDLESSLREVCIKVGYAGGLIEERFDFNDRQATIDGVPVGYVTVKVYANDNMGKSIVGDTFNVEIKADNVARPQLFMRPTTPDEVYLCIPNQLTTKAIKLHWIIWNGNDRKDNIECFILERCENGGNWEEISSKYADQRQTIDQNNINSGSSQTTYDYRIKIIEYNEMSYYSNIQTIQATTDVPKGLEIPEINGIEVQGANELRILWNYTDNMMISEFRIFRSDDNRENWSQVGVVGNNSSDFIDNTVEINREYWYRVIAVGQPPDNETSKLSNAYYIFVTQGGVNFLQPHLNIPTDNGNMISLSWVFSSSEEFNIDGFAIMRSTDGSALWNKIADVDKSQRSYDDMGFVDNEYNYYQIIALEGSTPHKSNTESIYKTSGTPNITADLFSLTESEGDVIIEWSFPQSEEYRIDGFEIRRFTDNSGIWDLVANVGPNMRLYNDNSYVPNVRNDYQIITIEGSNRYFSNVREITPGGKTGLEPNLHDPILGENDVYIEWDFPENERSNIDGFRVDRTIDMGENRITLANLDNTADSYHDPDYKDSAVNDYQVIAVAGADQYFSNVVTIAINFIPKTYNGTHDQLKNRLNTSANEVWVESPQSLPFKANVINSTVRDTNLFDPPKDITAVIATDDINPSTRYIFMGMPNDPSQVGLDEFNRPIVTILEDFINEFYFP